WPTSTSTASGSFGDKRGVASFPVRSAARSGALQTRDRPKLGMTFVRSGGFTPGGPLAQCGAPRCGGAPAHPQRQLETSNTCTCDTPPLKSMQEKRTFNTLRMRLERILEKAFPKESGAARLQQVGLFTLIYLMQTDKEDVTARRLSLMTG